MVKHIRRIGQQVQTPIVDYINTETGRRVTVVATSHAGEERYFSDLAAVIGRCVEAGAVVLYEGTKPRETTTGVSEVERAAREAWTEFMRLNQGKVKHLGWVWQAEALRPGDTWCHADIDDLTLVRLLGPERVLKMVTRGRKSLDWPDTDAVAIHKFRIRIAKTYRAWAAGFSLTRVITNLLTRGLDKIVVVHRTEVLGEYLNKALVEQDAVVVWGGEHLPGVHAHLLRHGFRPTSTVWKTIGTLPNMLVEMRACRDIQRIRARGGSA